MTDLKPCPFCGGEALMGVNKESTVREYFVGCMNCHIRLYKIGYKRFYTEAEAIAAWNTRVTHGTLTAEQVRDAIKSSTWPETDTTLEFGRSSWQEIADELNARAERTCRIIEYDEAPYPVCSECGAVQPDDFTVYYCWNCGAKVVGE